MSDTESFKSVASSYGDFTWIGRDGVKAAIDRLKAAHDREIRDVSQREFARGFNAGKHSMDAEHRAVAMRLRGLRFDGGSHENLARIAYAIYPCATGWTCESAAGLRDKLIDLMGGVSDGNCDCAGGGACAAGDGDCAGEQTEVSDDGADGGALNPDGRGHAGGRDFHELEVTDERVADDCGAAVRCGDGCGDLHMAGVSITDELRKFVDNNWPKILHETKTTKAYVLLRMADRIDAQFDRVCKQQEAVLQSTIDEMAGEIDKMRKEVIELREQRHELQQECGELQAKLGEHRGTLHLDALSDANLGETVAHLRIEKLVEQRDAARARTDELSDELLRTRRERDELRAKMAIIREAVDG